MTTLTLLDDALMARMAGGTNISSFDGGLFASNPPDRLQPVGGDLRHLIGPCPNPDGFQSAANPDAFPIGPSPNPDASGGLR